MHIVQWNKRERLLKVLSKSLSCSYTERGDKNVSLFLGQCCCLHMMTSNGTTILEPWGKFQSQNYTIQSGAISGLANQPPDTSILLLCAMVVASVIKLNLAKFPITYSQVNPNSYVKGRKKELGSKISKLIWLSGELEVNGKGRGGAHEDFWNEQEGR